VHKNSYAVGVVVVPMVIWKIWRSRLLLEGPFLYQKYVNVELVE